MKYLPIETDKIPYTFEVELSNRTYEITFKYNSYSDEITADLVLNDELLVAGKKLVMGEPIFEEFGFDNNGNKNSKFYEEMIVPYDLSWQENKVTIDNLGTKVLLYIIERDNNG